MKLHVLAAVFEGPIKEGMVFAVEPKKGITGVGMVGTENTYLVSEESGQSLTGANPGLILV